MPKYKLKIEYDGRNFVGWQRQDNGPSIQAAIEDALFNFSKERAQVVGAGRTDSGVHALSMIAHIELKNTNPDPVTVKRALNFHLGSQRISILETELAPATFHARFSATKRRYLYRILNRTAPPALEIGRVWFIPRNLDTEKMSQAAKELVGEHDFSSFRAKDCQAASATKTLSRLDVERYGSEIHISAEARSFLHRQVRNIVGTLKLVGEDRWSIAQVKNVLSARDRSQAGPTAPPEGLYLADVIYD
ncbi:MAG: tRNA pseudouridine(38-40) synthase TruA [Rhodospirillaceae bacterium]|nr:tRNA pseudouridine(38-40) synthase TruA [Rhodospirillaceae bacterium]|tara:strand:- start:113 stop:856 length:744 start_codon:yes stop_codon:yes gene_type:complete